MAGDLPPFGTDGIRGKAEAILGGARLVGQAGGAHFAPEGGTIALAWDPRESSPEIADELARGLVEAGANVERFGVMPTPGLAYLVREGDFAAGAMITASHNKYGDNGIKYFGASGEKLTDGAQDELSSLIEGGVLLSGRNRGVQYENPDAVSRYEDFLVATAEGVSFDGLRMVIDTANGAASGIAGRVFRRLGASVVMRADKPDGRNINENCGATHTGPLQEAVTKRHAAFGFRRPHMGVAFDGDADRLVMADGRGREFTGDHILYTLAAASQNEIDARKRHKGIVVTHMTNLGAENAMRAAGVDVVREDVGDRYVLRGLAETGYQLGGEQSGHVIMPYLLATGDGMLAAIQTIRAVRESGMSLEEWRDRVTLLPQSLVNLRGVNKAALGNPDVVEYVSGVTERLNGSGRVLIRPSGTEDMVRVMVEAPDAEEAAQAAASGLRPLLV
jgi:phosphoglucosamine mutase